MKKTVFIIFLNVCFILGCLLVAEHFAYKYTLKQREEHAKTFIIYEKSIKPFWQTKMKDDFDLEYVNDHSFRKPDGIDKNYKKPPIVLFGCSFTYGYKLNDDQTISHFLSEMSKRPVYNRGHNSWGLPHLVYQLSREDFYQNVPEPEYLIYVFSKHSIQMFYDYVFQLWDTNICLRYKEKNGKLIRVENPPKFIQGSYLLKIFYRKLAENSYNCKFSDKDENLAVLHFVTAKNEAQKHWKNTKYVVLFLDKITETEGFQDKLQSDLKKEGFVVLNAEDLTGFSDIPKKYRVQPDDPHPGEKYWQHLVPALIKKLNL